VKDVLPLLKSQADLERLFVKESAGHADPPTGWSPAMVMIHVAQWRERLWNALADAAQGRPVDPPSGDIDEFNDAAMAGAAGVSLADAAARADAALTSIIAMLETRGDEPFKWYTAETSTEAVVRNSYIHPRIHLADQFQERGDVIRRNALLEESASEMRRVEAPGHILGAAVYNVAGIRATQGRIDEALGLLEEAIPMREDLKAGAAADPDLASLRESPRFRALIEDPPAW
jgi:hypothetical protein